jgi:hypothetical protein
MGYNSLSGHFVIYNWRHYRNAADRIIFQLCLIEEVAVGII